MANYDVMWCLLETLIPNSILRKNTRMAGYYDVVLGLIPVVLAGITGVVVLSGYPLTVAILVASIVAVALIGHAMFVRAPVDRPPKGPRSGRTAD